MAWKEQAVTIADMLHDCIQVEFLDPLGPYHYACGMSTYFNL